MRTVNELIFQAIISEKGTILRDNENRYVFKVHPQANKIEIKKAIEKAFSVKVVDVKTINVKGKTKRLGRYEGRRSDWKKAIVRLKEGDTVDIFESV